jgi:AcrR family transcriptional regulator
VTVSEQEDPRVAGNRAAVQQAALHVLSSDGVAGLSVDRLAQVSGVSRSTIYRHWPDLRTLVAAAFQEIMHAPRPSAADAAQDPAAALLEYLREYARRLNDPTYATVLVTIIEWSWRDPQFAQAQARTFDDTRSRARAILQAGRATGVFDSSLSIDEAVEAVVAPFLYRRLVLRRIIREREIRALHRRLVPGS